MAYNVVINSKFNPFSYKEMLHPVLMADQEHKAVDEALGELGTKANIWENMANEQTDPKAFQMYKNYSNSLKEQANILSTQGLTPDSRKNMLNMKQRYSQDIVPIEQAYTRRKELQDEQRKLQAQNPSVIYSLDANKLSLDQLVENPALQYQSTSGELLSKQVGTAASQLKKQMQEEITNNPEKASKWKTILGGQYFERILKDGFSKDEVLQAMQGQGPQVLVDLVDSVIDSSGVKEWNNQDALNRAREFANQGLYQAIGDYKVDRVNNKMFDFMMQEKLRKKAKEEEQATAPLPYTIIPNTVVKGNNATIDVANRDMKLIENIIKNPNILKAPEKDEGFSMSKSPGEEKFVKDMVNKYGISESLARQRYAESNPWYGAEQNQLKLNKENEILSGFNTKSNAEYYNAELPKLMQKYGANSVEQLYNNIQRVQKSNAVTTNDYAIRFADMGLSSETVKRNILSRQGDTGVKELKDNGDLSRKALSGDDVRKIFKDMDPNFIYNASANKWVIRVNDGDNTKDYAIDTKIIDPTGQLDSYTQALDFYKQKEKSGSILSFQDINEMNELSHNMMMIGASSLNNAHKTQSKSGDEKGSYPLYNINK